MIIEKKTIWDVLETLLSTFYACIYAEKNEIKRISIGIAFEIACVAFAIFIGVSSIDYGPLQGTLLGLSFVIGLFLIPDNAKKADALLMRAGFELVELIAALVAGLTIYSVLSGTNTWNPSAMQLSLFAALVVAFAYIIKICILVYRGIKTMLNLFFKKAKSLDGIEEGVSKWESILKNVGSIAATLFLIAEVGKKIIELF